jgi:hypothetical protein
VGRSAAAAATDRALPILESGRRLAARRGSGLEEGRGRERDFPASEGQIRPRPRGSATYPSISVPQELRTAPPSLPGLGFPNWEGSGTGARFRVWDQPAPPQLGRNGLAELAVDEGRGKAWTISPWGLTFSPRLRAGLSPALSVWQAWWNRPLAENQSVAAARKTERSTNRNQMESLAREVVSQTGRFARVPAGFS